ncbi:MAG: glycosyltransferase family 39 protein [Armatimonadetes bacterium]|nr:glycosyltransferase family 39 protein [Armatimonadota bacterium]
MSKPAEKPREPGSRHDIRIPEQGWLGLLVFAFVVSSVAYARMLPYGQGPDEESHGLFVECLAGQAPAGTRWAWGLPVFDTTDDDANFETHQPPLYYVVAAVVWRAGGSGAVRAWSLLCGVLLLLVTWRLARDLLAADLALAATAVVALLPMNCFLATRVNNDPLANVLWAGALWRWICSLRDGPSLREGLLAGLWVGAALLTKQNSVALLPLAVLAAVPMARTSGRTRAALTQLGVTLAVAAALAGWWYLRNRVLYGDFFAQHAFDARFLPTRMTPERLAEQFKGHPEWRYWPYFGEWVTRTFVIYIGHNLFLLPKELYPLQLGLTALAACGAVAATARRWRRSGLDAGVAAAVLGACALVEVTALLVRFNCTYWQAQGRYLFLALPCWGLLYAGGLSRIFPPGSALRRYAVGLAPAWFGLLNLMLLVEYVPGLLRPA